MIGVKTYEQIAQAMYEAYAAEEVKGSDMPPFKWKDENSIVHDYWIAAAKEAARQFDIPMIEDHKGIGDLDDLRIERAYPDHEFN